LGWVFERALLAKAWGRGLSVVMLRVQPDGRYRTLAVAGLGLDATVTIYIAWNGVHWLRARVREVSARAIDEWRRG